MTTTTEVPRVVGDHPGSTPVLLSGLALFVAIAAAALVVRRRTAAKDETRKGGG